LMAYPERTRLREWAIGRNLEPLVYERELMPGEGPEPLGVC
jgi:hypothetical protein